MHVQLPACDTPILRSFCCKATVTDDVHIPQCVRHVFARGIGRHNDKMSGDRAVVTLLYRCMLRWNKALSSVPLELRPSHVDEVLPGFRKQHHGDVSSIRDLAQWGFRQHDAGSAAVLVRFVSCRCALIQEDCCNIPI